LRRLAWVALLASGCSAVAPGLHVSEEVIEGRGTEAAPVRILPITPDLLAHLAAERARATGTRARDPLADESARYVYRIAPMDVLSVTVWDHPELTIPAGEFRAAEIAGHVVQSDGTIFYPHVGVVPVEGRTVPEVRAFLTERLRKIIEEPQLDVRVVAFRGKRAQVTGQVVQPSVLPITDVPLRVQDAISAARGLGPNAFPRAVTLTRDGKVHRLNLQALYDEGDVTQNWLLRDGDVLHVPSREEHKVFVLGEVKQPSSKLMPYGRMTLADAIGDSAGFDQLTSNPGGVYVFRGSYQAPSVYRLDASSADALLLAAQFELQPHDVIFVSPYKLTSWNRVVLQLLPTVQGLWQSVDLADRGFTTVQENR
jgi:polysaccharide export outer membrane protein